MDTHCDDSCQQHRGTYQYIVDDLISHDRSCTSSWRRQPYYNGCFACGGLEMAILASVPLSYCVIVLLWPWTIAELLGSCHKPAHCNPHTVRGKQIFGPPSGGDITVQRLAVGCVVFSFCWTGFFQCHSVHSFIARQITLISAASICCLTLLCKQR